MGGMHFRRASQVIHQLQLIVNRIKTLKLNAATHLQYLKHAYKSKANILRAYLLKLELIWLWLNQQIICRFLGDLIVNIMMVEQVKLINSNLLA